MLFFVALALATPGEVTMPLSAWQALQPSTALVRPPGKSLPLARSLTGRVERGLLTATLSAQVVAPSTIQLAVLPAGTTVADARLDGRPAPLSLDDHYRVDLLPGVHTVTIDLLHGEATDRFERRVRLPLPDGGPTRFDLVIPESPIDVTLASGVVTSTQSVDAGTRVVGWLDGSGDLDLSWERRATHDTTDAQLDATAHALLELGGDLVHGRGAVGFEVLAGDVDRVALTVPDGLEITAVNGGDVLQWHTADGALQVLLRRVVDDRVDLDVRFQYPAERDAPTRLRMPLPEGNVRGALGVVAPVALDVELATVDGATPIAPRDIPQSLVELSAEPLRLAMAFEGPVEASATSTRQGEVLTSASRIEDLQGISIAMEDGTEVGKLRLAVRNADRQVLSVDLPADARLTHCFRDGTPLRPAADAARPGRVLVPLTRSAKNAPRTYTVEPGDTLSAIARDNYGDANRWQHVQWANPQLANAELQVGQVINIPALSDGDTESFVLELGWERIGVPMDRLGSRTVALPSLDLDVQAATWHVYLPEHLETLTVDANLVQLSGRHTDPLTRIADFLVHSGALGQSAYAGESYVNALKSRRSTFAAEQKQQAGAEPLSAYPLVGQRIRFRGHLLGTEAPRVTIRYVSKGLANSVRFIALLAAVGIGWQIGRRPRAASSVAVAGLAAGGGLIVGHYLLGTYGRLAWGANLGLLLALVPWAWAHRRRPRVVEVMGFGGAGFVALILLIAKPTLIPLILAPSLLAISWRVR